MIKDFINSAVIIDDREDEIFDLKSLLEQEQIFVRHYLPSELIRDKPKLKNRKIIFLDLFIEEGKEIEAQLSYIRRIFSDSIGNDFGTYGIILWTKHLLEGNKHSSDYNLFIKKFYNSNDKYELPLFIIGLDKTKYLRNGFGDLFEDINKGLEDNISANFFIKWELLIREAKHKSISSIYDLIKSDIVDLKESNLQFILFLLAQNFNGIPHNKIAEHNLTADALKSLADMLNYEINERAYKVQDIFKGTIECFYKHQLPDNSIFEYSSKNHLNQKRDDKIFRQNGITISNAQKKQSKDNIEKIEKKVELNYSEINKKLLLDHIHVDPKVVIPGNVYKIINNNTVKINKNERPMGSIPIVIEITPPCDFANNKKGKSRIISGFIADYNEDNYTNFVKNKGENCYKELWPISIDEVGKSKMIVFDFKHFSTIKEDTLLNSKSFKLLFRVKDKLFADILQKLSSHTARLGVSILH